MRISAAIVVVILAVYHVLRLVAAHCAGSACDAYIPLSLVLPPAAIVMVAVTAVLAVRAAGGRRAWIAAFVVTGVLGVLGPVAALAIWRDSPDVLVPVATVLILLCPVCVLAYSLFGRRQL